MKWVIVLDSWMMRRAPRGGRFSRSLVSNWTLGTRIRPLSLSAHSCCPHPRWKARLWENLVFKASESPKSQNTIVKAHLGHAWSEHQSWQCYYRGGAPHRFPVIWLHPRKGLGWGVSYQRIWLSLGFRVSNNQYFHIKIPCVPFRASSPTNTAGPRDVLRPLCPAVTCLNPQPEAVTLHPRTDPGTPGQAGPLFHVNLHNIESPGSFHPTFGWTLATGWTRVSSAVGV